MTNENTEWEIGLGCVIKFSSDEDFNSMKKFISRLIKKEREKLKAEILNCVPEEKKGNYSKSDYYGNLDEAKHLGHNQCREDMLKRLEEL